MTPWDPHRRQRILDATRTLIPRYGLAGITDRRVAAEAGVPVGLPVDAAALTAPLAALVALGEQERSGRPGSPPSGDPGRA